MTGSGEVAEAIPLWTAAGRRSAAGGAHIEAVSHYETAIRLLLTQPEDRPRAEQELQLRLELIASLSASRSHSSPEVAKALAETRAVCDALGTFDGLFKLLRSSYVFALSAGDLVAAEDAARRCVDASKASGLPEQRIEAECALGAVLMSTGEFEPAKMVLEHAMRLYVETGGAGLTYSLPQDPFAVYHVFLAEVLIAMGDDDGARLAIDTALEHARSVGGPYTQAVTTCYVACFFNRQGDYGRSLAHATEAAELSDLHGYQHTAVLAGKVRAVANAMLGQPGTALEIVQAAHEQHERFGVRYKRCETLADIAKLHAAAGDMRSALAAIDAAIEDSERYGDRHFLSPLHRMRAGFLDRLPDADPAEVRHALERAIGVARNQRALGFARQAEAMLAARLTEAD